MNIQKAVRIQYYNVDFYLYVNTDNDLVNINYFIQSIDEDMRMRDIFNWCKDHNITCLAQFKYRKDFPFTANLWNFYSYVRTRLSIGIV